MDWSSSILDKLSQMNQFLERLVIEFVGFHRWDNILPSAIFSGQ